MRLPTSIKGALLGLLIYDALLVFHLARFGGVHYCVPNIAGWAGRYPGFGWTWELSAINLPVNLIDDVPSLRERWVVPQSVAFYVGEFKAPKAWSATTWVISGVVGNTLAGLVLGGLTGFVRGRARWAHPVGRG